MPEFAHDLWKIVPAVGVSISLATGVDDDTEDRWSYGVAPVAGESPHQRTLTSEMKVGGAMVGRLTVVGTSQQRYMRHHLSLLNTVASNIAGAIAAAEMHAQSMELAETRLEWEQAQAESRELQRVAAAKSDFLATVSHELRTPLTSILAFADVLTRNKPGNLIDKQTRHLEIIQRSGRRLAVLIDDLLDATHIEQSKFELMPVRFDVGEMLSDLADSFGPILREKNQKFVMEIPETSPDTSNEIFADQIRLTQVISNLVTNASKYSDDGSEVKLTLEFENEDVLLVVEDHGIGITREDLPNVFGAFFRADNEGTRAQSGTGIGLYFCRLIVNHHKGEIIAESEVGEGTTMTVRLPREYVSEAPEEDAVAA
jgi:signal transduction histidine kinase